MSAGGLFSRDDAVPLCEWLGSRAAGHLTRKRYEGISATAFCRAVLGIHPCKLQRTIFTLCESRARRVAVYTGHGIGKTFAAAALVCWWLYAGGPGTVVVTSAPTNRQVEHLLWREINTLWSRSAELLNLGRPNTTKIALSPDWVAYGFSTNDPQRFQGWHAPRLRILIDEANGFPEALWESIDACLTGADTQLVMLGNPIVPVGYFFKCSHDPNVARAKISSRTHPNVRSNRALIPGAVTREWISNFERQYQHSPAIIGARIDGEFPESYADGVVPLEWLRWGRSVTAATHWPVVMGVDVARFGDARSVLTIFEGQRLVRQLSWGQCSTTETTARIADAYDRFGGDAIVVDDDGVGGGVTDQLRARDLPVVAFRGGLPACDPSRFVNRIAEAWWTVRELCEQRALDLSQIAEGEFDQQFATRRYVLTTAAKIRLEPKDEYAQRTGLPSPDEADSFAMAVWHIVQRWQSAAAGLPGTPAGAFNVAATERLGQR